MATHYWKQNIEFTAGSADYELLTDAGIVAAIRERMGWTAAELTTKLAGDGIRDMYFSITLDADDTININGGVDLYTLSNVYSTGDYVRAGITSITVHTSGRTGTFVFNIL